MFASGYGSGSEYEIRMDVDVSRVGVDANYSERALHELNRTRDRDWLCRVRFVQTDEDICEECRSKYDDERLDLVLRTLMACTLEVFVLEMKNELVVVHGNSTTWPWAARGVQCG